MLKDMKMNSLNWKKENIFLKNDFPENNFLRHKVFP